MADWLSYPSLLDKQPHPEAPSWFQDVSLILRFFCYCPESYPQVPGHLSEPSLPGPCCYSTQSSPDPGMWFNRPPSGLCCYPVTAHWGQSWDVDPPFPDYAPWPLAQAAAIFVIPGPTALMHSNRTPAAVTAIGSETQLLVPGDISAYTLALDTSVESWQVHLCPKTHVPCSSTFWS